MDVRWQSSGRAMCDRVANAACVINCEDIAWSIFGLSAATINSLLLFLIFILNAIYLWNNYGEKKENNN